MEDLATPRDLIHSGVFYPLSRRASYALLKSFMTYHIQDKKMSIICLELISDNTCRILYKNHSTELVDMDSPEFEVHRSDGDILENMTGLIKNIL